MASSPLHCRVTPHFSTSLFKMIDEYQNLERKDENELEIHLMEESLIWGMSQDLYFQNCHQVDKNPCSQFRHISQKFVLFLATACTSTIDVNELSMANYIISSVMHAFWLVLTYDLLEDRRIDDVIIKTFFNSLLYKTNTNLESIC